MSASIMDTAELPASPPAARVSPLEDVRLDVGDLVRSRVAVRRARQQLRRQRHLYAAGGVATLVLFLALTVYVVDVIR